MAIEFIAMMRDARTGTDEPVSVLAADPDYPARVAIGYEEAGFDWILIEQSPTSADSFAIASQVLMTTSHIGVLLSCPQGAVAPTVAARQYATMDAFYPGRVGLHLRLEADGTPGDAMARRQSGEFLQILGHAWSSAAPFDYDGEFYRVKGSRSPVRPAAGRVPVYVTGGDDRPGPRGARVDVQVFGREPAEALRARIARARLAGRGHGQPARFGVALAGGPEQLGELLPGYLAAGVSAVLIHDPGPEGDAPDYAAAIRRARAAARQGLVA
jgi:alkanesulfonate monooxygenase